MLATGTIVIAMGLTRANMAQLNLMATDPDVEHVLYVPTFEDMDEYILQVKYIICKHSLLNW